MVLVEVLEGFGDDRHFRRAGSLLDDLTFVEMLGHERAIAAARLFRRLRRQGITVRETNDVIIGSYRITEGVPLLFFERDFREARRSLRHEIGLAGTIASILPGPSRLDVSLAATSPLESGSDSSRAARRVTEQGRTAGDVPDALPVVRYARSAAGSRPSVVPISARNSIERTRAA